MPVDFTALIAICIAALALIAAARAFPLPMSRHSLVKKTVIVHTKDGQSVRGALYAQHADRVTLTQAVYLQDKQPELPIDGLAHVPCGNVAWIQELAKAE